MLQTSVDEPVVLLEPLPIERRVVCHRDRVVDHGFGPLRGVCLSFGTWQAGSSAAPIESLEAPDAST